MSKFRGTLLPQFSGCVEAQYQVAKPDLKDMITKPTNEHKCRKVSYYKHYIPSTCFDHSCGLPRGFALRMEGVDITDIKNVCEPMHRCQILRFNNTLRC